MYLKVSGKGQTRLCALFVFPLLHIVDFVNGFRATDVASTSLRAGSSHRFPYATTIIFDATHAVPTKTRYHFTFADHINRCTDVKGVISSTQNAARIKHL